MSLGIPFDDIVKERLQVDSVFRKESLKGAIECLDAGEFRIAEKMLRLQVEATIGYEKLGELMNKAPENIRDMLIRLRHQLGRTLRDNRAYLQA